MRRANKSFRATEPKKQNNNHTKHKLVKDSKWNFRARFDWRLIPPQPKKKNKSICSAFDIRLKRNGGRRHEMRFNKQELATLATQPSNKFEKEGILYITERQDGFFRRTESKQLTHSHVHLFTQIRHIDPKSDAFKINLILSCFVFQFYAVFFFVFGQHSLLTIVVVV